MTTAKLHPTEVPRLTGAEIGAWLLFGLGLTITLLAAAGLANLHYGDEPATATTWLYFGAGLSVATLAPALILTGLRLLARNVRHFLAREVEGTKATS